MITPAISVLSAVEGLKLAAPALEHYVVPLTVLILVALFSVQSSGTARVASAFGPVMVVWFATIAVMGLIHISDDPSVLAAINPWYGIQFLLSHGIIGLVTLGAVFLAVTGGEALYADLGHFGRKPIQGAWLYLVCRLLLEKKKKQYHAVPRQVRPPEGTTQSTCGLDESRRKAAARESKFSDCRADH